MPPEWQGNPWGEGLVDEASSLQLVPNPCVLSHLVDHDLRLCSIRHAHAKGLSVGLVSREQSVPRHLKGLVSLTVGMGGGAQDGSACQCDMSRSSHASLHDAIKKPEPWTGLPP
eukprot:1148251-Pelagomonas_calceolata.AAC.10